MTAPRTTPIVEAIHAPAPFDTAWFDTVFLVPHPPEQWPEVFAIVTANNPGGRVQPEADNSLSERELDDYLRRQGLVSFAVVGASPDLRHREAGRGFAIGDPAVAARVAARFGQQGFFWVEAGVVFICVDDSGKGWTVARWEERLVPR